MKKLIMIAFCLCLSGCFTREDFGYKDDTYEYYFLSESNYKSDDYFLNRYTNFIDDSIIEELSDNEDVLSIYPLFYLSSSLLRNNQAYSYISLEMNGTYHECKDMWHLEFGEYYDITKVEDRMLKELESDDTKINAYVSTRTLYNLGLIEDPFDESQWANIESISFEVAVAVPITNTKDDSLIPEGMDVYIDLSNRYYQKVMLNISVKGILEPNTMNHDNGEGIVLGSDDILISHEDMQLIIENHQLEELKPGGYVIEVNSSSTINQLKEKYSDYEFILRLWDE